MVESKSNHPFFKALEDMDIAQHTRHEDDIKIAEKSFAKWLELLRSKDNG